MSFDEIDPRLKKLGKDRAWLAAQCDYSTSTLASALAPNGSNKTPKALRRMWEALDREEQRQKQEKYKPAPLTNTVTLTPTVDQFDRWMRAAYRNHDSFDEWAKEGLDALADLYPQKDQITIAADAPDLPATELPERQSTTYHRAKPIRRATTGNAKPQLGE